MYDKTPEQSMTKKPVALLDPTVLHPRHPIKHSLARTVIHQVSRKVAMPLKLNAFGYTSSLSLTSVLTHFVFDGV